MQTHGPNSTIAMTEEIKQADRIQTSLLNGIEKKVLVWLAERQPKWVTSDFLTFLGVLGAALAGAGYWLSDNNLTWLWLSTFGIILNWYGDSLDGTLARVRKCQRKIYGYYLDHTIDGICEGLVFLGIGLSNLVYLPLALIAHILYLLMTINVSINAHLRGQFKLTYAKLGPTEFRLIVIIINTLMLAVPAITDYRLHTSILGHNMVFTAFDLAGIIIIAILAAIYFVTILNDARAYAKIDPLIKK